MTRTISPETDRALTAMAVLAASRGDDEQRVRDLRQHFTNGELVADALETIGWFCAGKAGMPLADVLRRTLG
ncbi:hypothetical protein ACWC10_00070 [Streptomyces sp. NPDC001595]|uniref:hypothetical protein n=1 Tax=Streptomyces sp. NPDC001532 TaxID=3154520 RepID=UPI0033346E4C